MAEPQLDPGLAALADPTRRAIVERLAHGPARVGDLAAPFAMTFSAVSKHIGVLESAGLVRREKRGRERLCHLEAEPLREIERWAGTCRRFWEGRLEALEEHLQARAAARETEMEGP